MSGLSDIGFFTLKMIGKDQKDLIRMSNFTFFEHQFRITQQTKLKWKVKILAIDVLSTLVQTKNSWWSV